MKILTLNLGSSSLKYALYDASEQALAVAKEGEVATAPDPASARGAARAVLEQLETAGDAIDAAGHRVVFAGNEDQPAIVSDELLARLHALESLDPLHLPGALAIVDEVRSRLPQARNVACFDTAFFRDLPHEARVLPIPGGDPLLRRYGFHGLSYESAVHAIGGELRSRTVIAHLGNGASAAALIDGVPIDTTMGFSPLGGLIMSTRPGDLDPGVLLYLLERGHTDAAGLRDMLERRSGLRALSGGESDLRQLGERSDDTAAFAVEMFVRSASKAIAALAAVLGGLEMLVFTGGIGEHNDAVRNAIASRTAFINRETEVRVVKSDENRAIARRVWRLVRS